MVFDQGARDDGDGLGFADRRDPRARRHGVGPQRAGAVVRFLGCRRRSIRRRGNRENGGPRTKGGAPMARAVLTTLIFLAAALAAVENVAAQEATPTTGATPVPACNVAPRPETELIALNASPSPVAE